MTDMRGLVAFLHESGQLKRSRRAGWWIAGISDPESVAEHSFRTAIVGYVIAALEGADPERTAAVCLFHDVPEARVGDVPSTGKRYLTEAPPQDVIADQTANLPAAVADRVRRLVAEYEDQDSPEARCAKDADKLECLLQAREYQQLGARDVQPWIDTMVTAVRTETGRALAKTACERPPNEWWYEIVSSYGSPRTEPGARP